MNITIGKRLLQLRKEHQYSQQELATKLNVTRQTISKWEQDLSLPDLDLLMKISEIYNEPITRLLGVEADHHSIQEIYDQIQTSLKKNNQHHQLRNVIQIILVIICVTSLILMTSMQKEINRLTQELENQAYLESIYDFEKSQYLLSNAIHYLNEDIPQFYSVSLNANNYDPKNGTLDVDYQFTLTEYNEATQLTIELSDHFNDPITYPLEKVDNNVFTFQKTIPLRNYLTVNLRIDQGYKIEVIDLNKHRSFDYLQYVLYSQIHLYMPVDNNNLQRDTLVYDSSFATKMRYENFISPIKGKLYLKLTSENGDLLLDEVWVNIDSSQTIHLNNPLPLNEKIFITIRYDIQDTHYAQGGALNIGDNNTSYSYFILEENQLNRNLDILKINRQNLQEILK